MPLQFPQQNSDEDLLAGAVPYKPPKQAPASDEDLLAGAVPYQPSKFDKLTPEQAELKGRIVEAGGGKSSDLPPAYREPGLEDAPVANAVMAGALTPGAWAMRGLSMGERGIPAALKAGRDFGIQQGLQDWVVSKLPKGFQKHPWLSEAAGIAGGTAMFMAGQRGISALRGAGTPEARAPGGIDVLQKLAQRRALTNNDEAASGSQADIFPEQPKAPAEAPEPAQPTEAPAPAPKEPQKALEYAPTANPVAVLIDGSRVELNRLGTGGPQPGIPDREYLAGDGSLIDPKAVKQVLWPKGTARAQQGPILKPEPQPKEVLNEAVANNDPLAAKKALNDELSLEPDASTYRMKLSDIKRDPDRFQYKTRTNSKTGADTALEGIKVFDRGLSNPMTVYHDQDNQFYLVNGHGRYARLDELGGPGAEHSVKVIESRAPDDPLAAKGAVKYGYTPEQARGYGALQNIAEGRGTAMDAARFFRQQGADTKAMEQAGISLSPTEEKTQKAVALARLDPAVFNAVDVGMIPEKHGVVIGRELGDRPELQQAILRDYKSMGGKEISAQKLADKIRFQKSAGTVLKEQTTLFGKEELKKSLADEFADVIGGIRNRLKGEKRLFGISPDAAKKLEEAGVAQVDVDTGERLSAAAANNLAILQKNAFSAGTPINEVLRQAATDLSENPKNKASIIKDAYDKMIERMSGMPAIEPEAEPSPQAAFTLGVGAPVVQAAERLIGMLPESVKNKPRAAGEYLTRAWAPERVSAFSERAAQLKSSAAAELRARLGSMSEGLRPLREYFQSLPYNERWRLASDMERGNLDNLPDAFKPFGPVMQSLSDEPHGRLEKLTPDKRVSYIENYWRHLWANSPDQVRDAYERFRAGSGKSFTEGGGFLKQRKFPTFEDGIKSGLTPKFKNPIDMWQAGMRQEWRYVTGHELWNSIKDMGIAKFGRIGQAMPKNLAKIDDSIARVITPEGLHSGDWYVPTEVARVFNNYLHPGLGQNLFTSLSALGNRVRIEASAFHFLLTSISHVGQQVGNQFVDGVGDIASGNVIRGASKIASSPLRVATAPVDTYRDWARGRSIIGRARAGDFEDPEVRAAMLGGEGFNHAWDNASNVIGDTWRDLFGLPGRLTERLNPIMKHWVAPLKVGSFMRLYDAAMEQAAKGFSDGEVPFAMKRQIAYEVRQHVDNVMGQISRDNLHFANWLKDGLHGVIAYPGWQIGGVRLGGGAIRGVGKALTGKNVDMQAQLAMRYLAGMIITDATLSSVWNFLVTGKPPQSMADFFLWKTGKKDANGNDIRDEGPFYMIRDAQSLYSNIRKHGTSSVMGPAKAVGDVLASKANWPLAAAAYLYKNADYYGNPITFEDFESQPKQIQDMLKYAIMEGFSPFSIRNIQQGIKEGGLSAGPIARSIVGLAPEPRALRQTAAENFVDRFKPPNQPPSTPSQGRKQKVLGDFEVGLRQQLQGGKRVDTAPVLAGLREHLFTQKDIDKRLDKAMERPFSEALKHTPAWASVKAWKIAKDHGDMADERDAAAAIETHIKSGKLTSLSDEEMAVVRPILREYFAEHPGD